jgi:hypothetical protein
MLYYKARNKRENNDKKMLPVLTPRYNLVPSSCNCVMNAAVHNCYTRLVHQPVSPLICYPQIPTTTTLCYTTPVIQYPSFIQSCYYPMQVAVPVAMQVQIDSGQALETQLEGNANTQIVDSSAEIKQKNSNSIIESEKRSVESTVHVDFCNKVISTK